MVVEQIMNGLMLACMYALVAVGFTLFFGVLDLVNFAHGEAVVLGAFATIALYNWLYGPMADGGLLAFLWIGLTVVALVGAVGVAVERVAIRPLRGAPPLLLLLATVGVGIALREGVRLFYPQGSNPQVFPYLLPFGGTEIFGAFILYDNLLILGIGIAMIIGSQLLISRTRIGATIRAAAQDREAAMMMGINLNRTVAATFLLGSALGAVAGILNGTYYGIVRYDMGLMAGIKGFSAAVVGGLGSFYGALVGSLLLSLVETSTIIFVPNGSQYRDVFAFLVVIIFLIWRPTGILGERVIEKV